MNPWQMARLSETARPDHLRAMYRRQMSQMTRPGDTSAKPFSHGKLQLYKLLTLVVALPVVIAGTIGLVYCRDEHKSRPPFVPYTYLRIRSKKFPWGDGNHSLFHNPKMNALPDGYETPDEPDE